LPSEDEVLLFLCTGYAEYDARCVSAPRQGTGTTPGSCDRSCLTKITADYVDALQLKNTTYVAFDGDVRYTDAGVEKTPGTGLMWTIAGGVRLPWRQAIYSASTGQVFFNAIFTNFTDAGVNYASATNASS